MPPSDSEISEEVLEEGSYHLKGLGLTEAQIAAHFEIPAEAVPALISSYESKLKSGKVGSSEFDRVFWADVKKEAEGDVKLTFLSDKGFHHAWKSELRKLDGPALMAIYEASKDFVGADPNQKFLDYPPPKGYDPLAMDRELRRAVEVVGELLAEKWEEASDEQRPPKL
ncbi:MAG: hypothetical protein JRN34_04075 [Nitrososphaerota archaeon]|nr:hypothetical protein [Nitrososphaerota archaeon]MDG6942084.1 hypothetical protein [Nitrososphaerota archaeon]MDG6942549.1 hypothetical protein [Nitrososphaerota archaeon]MDG6948336.1 hypothetical protein [Nitrososphaerota archaeon]MDG6950262.1 hypothetical protein [Nitrososphaerota archaeon]